MGEKGSFPLGSPSRSVSVPRSCNKQYVRVYSYNSLDSVISVASMRHFPHVYAHLPQQCSALEKIRL